MTAKIYIDIGNLRQGSGVTVSSQMRAIIEDAISLKTEAFTVNPDEFIGDGNWDGVNPVASATGSDGQPLFVPNVGDDRVDFPLVPNPNYRDTNPYNYNGLMTYPETLDYLEGTSLENKKPGEIVQRVYERANTTERTALFSRHVLPKIASLSEYFANESIASGDQDFDETKKEIIDNYYRTSTHHDRIIKSLSKSGKGSLFSTPVALLGHGGNLSLIEDNDKLFPLEVIEHMYDAVFNNYYPEVRLAERLSLPKEFEGQKIFIPPSLNFGEEGTSAFLSTGNFIYAVSANTFFSITGFDDFLESNEADLNPFDTDVDNFNQLVNATKDEAGANINRHLGASRTGVKTAQRLSAEDFAKVLQCTLITDLLNKGWSYKEYPKIWNAGEEGDGDTPAPPFHGRIYPVSTKFANIANSLNEPEILVNNLDASPKESEAFKTEDLGSRKMFWQLDWVYVDGAGETKETKIFKSGNDYENFINGLSVEKDFSSLPFYDDDGVAIEEQISNITNYVMSQIEVKFEGTDPASATRDLQATLTINLPNLRGISSICAIVPQGQVDGESVSITNKYLRIHQLVTAPTAQTNETKTLFQSSLKNSYSADDFRLRLSLWAEGYKDNMIKVDLTTVDHSIDRKDDSLGSAVMTINYRGYIDQLFSHPMTTPTVSAKTISLYKEAQEKIAKLINDTKCTGKLLQSVKVSYDRILNNQIKTDVENNVLFDKLFENSRIFETRINRELVNVNVYGNSVDPRQNYIVGYDSPTAFTRLSQDAKLVNKEIKTVTALEAEVLGVKGGFTGVSGDTYEEVDFTDADLELLGKQKSQVIFLGDFLTYIVDSLYEGSTNEMNDLFKQAPTRFIMTPIRVPNPAFWKIGAPEDEQEFITINPVQIPLSLPYIADWYENTFIKKDLTGLSVRDLLNNICQDIINTIVYETCFNIFDKEYKPPLLKTTNLVDHSDKWLKYNKEGWLDLDSIGEDNIVIMKTNAKDENVDISLAKNYVLFHQYLPSAADSQPAKQTKKENPKVPTLYYGSNFADTNYCSDVSFSKTDIEYLKEARVFNSGFGQLALLSNVYDLSFAFDSVKGSTFFLPGKKINFILTDWAGANKYHIGEDLGESDPHVKGRIANVLGFGGYYIITRVTYTLKSTSANDFVIKIDSKFAGTDAIEAPTEAKEVSEDKAIKVDLPVECLQAARDLAVRANLLSEDDVDQDILLEDPDAIKDDKEPASVDKPEDGQGDGATNDEPSSNETKETEVVDPASAESADGEADSYPDGSDVDNGLVGVDNIDETLNGNGQTTVNLTEEEKDIINVPPDSSELIANQSDSESDPSDVSYLEEFPEEPAGDEGGDGYLSEEEIKRDEVEEQSDTSDEEPVAANTAPAVPPPSPPQPPTPPKPESSYGNLEELIVATFQNYEGAGFGTEYTRWTQAKANPQVQEEYVSAIQNYQENGDPQQAIETVANIMYPDNPAKILNDLQAQEAQEKIRKKISETNPAEAGTIAKEAGDRNRNRQSTTDEETQKIANTNLANEIVDYTNKWEEEGLSGKPPTFDSSPSQENVDELKKAYFTAKIQKTKDDIDTLKRRAEDVGISQGVIDLYTSDEPTEISPDSPLSVLEDASSDLNRNMNNLGDSINDKIEEENRKKQAQQAAEEAAINAVTTPQTDKSNTIYYYLLALKRAPIGVIADIPDNIVRGPFVRFERQDDSPEGYRVFYLYRGDDPDPRLLTIKE